MLLSLNDAHLHIVMTNIDIDSIVGHLHLKVLVVETVHVVVAVEVLLGITK